MAYNAQIPSASDGMPYGITPDYSPKTNVQITLRQFEKDAKAQAEREFDAEHGPLPEQPDPSETPLGVERNKAKKKRKVRSAIVSRRKSAIYVEFLEANLEMRHNINVALKTRIELSQDVLRSIATRIKTLEDVLDRKRPASPKRERTLPANVSQPASVPGTFFLVDDMLSISPEDMTMAQSSFTGAQSTHVASTSFTAPQPTHVDAPQLISETFPDTDFESDCSDKQSPITSCATVSLDAVIPTIPKSVLRADSSWRGFIPQNHPTLVTGTRAI